jgi:hypothetical protein
MCLLHVPAALSMMHVHVTYPCCITVLHVLASCPCCMSLIHALAQWKVWKCLRKC